MKILHSILTDDFFGSENHCAQLAAAQIKAGHVVRVLIKGRNRIVAGRFAGVVGPENLVVLPRWWPGFLDSWAAKRVIAGFLPDVVHVHLGRAAARVGKVAKKLGIPAVGTLHLTYKAKDYAHLNGLICVAEFQKKAEAQRLKDYAGPVTVVRNWVEPVPVPDAENVQVLRSKLGLGGEVFMLGSVGRLNKQKGYDVLIPAFKKAFAKRTDVALVLVGEGENRAALKELAGSDSRIHFAGYQPNVSEWLGAFDGFVSSSRYEGLALVGLEALQAGLPMLVTDVAGNAEMAALCKLPTVPVDDVAALAKGLEKMIEGGRGPFKRNLEPFSKPEAVKAITAFYKQIGA